MPDSPSSGAPLCVHCGRDEEHHVADGRCWTTLEGGAIVPGKTRFGPPQETTAPTRNDLVAEIKALSFEAGQAGRIGWSDTAMRAADEITHLRSTLSERDALKALVDWLQSRLSDEEHIEFHTSGNEYEALLCDVLGTVMVRGDGPSLEEAVAALRRADAEQRGQR